MFNAQKDKWCVHISNYQAICCITTLISWLLFRLNFMLHNSVDYTHIIYPIDYIQLYNIKSVFICIMTNVDVFEWYICHWVWDAVDVASIVQVKAYWIGINCIRSSELWNGIQMNTTILTSLSRDKLYRLSDYEMINKYSEAQYYSHSVS